MRNPYLDSNNVDRSDEIEAAFAPTIDDIGRDPQFYAELVNDLFWHWVYGTPETALMNMVKENMLKNK
jgi:hypothetical protein